MRPTFSWILLLFAVLKSVIGGGSLKMKLISYYNRHGYDRNRNYCDPTAFNTGRTSKCDYKMRLTLDGRDNGIGPHWDKMTSHIFHEQDSVRFPAYFGYIEGNPIEKRFASWTGRLLVHLDVVDYDAMSGNDHVDSLSKSISVRPDGITKRHNIHGHIHGDRSRFDFELTVRCDKHYYPPKCTKYCKPRNDRKGHYMCDGFGKKLCLKGWQNPRGKCLEVSDPCHKKTCHNGGWCVKNSQGTRCSCRPGFYGTQCEKKFTVDVCRNLTCLNGGKCLDDRGRALCHCNSPFFGLQCELCDKEGEGGDTCPMVNAESLLMPVEDNRFQPAFLVIPLLVLLIVIAFFVFRQRKRFQSYLPGFLQKKTSRSRDSFDNAYYSASDRPSNPDSEVAIIRDVANNAYDLEDPAPSECSQEDYGSLYGSLEEDTESIADDEKVWRVSCQPPALPPRNPVSTMVTQGQDPNANVSRV